MAFSLSVYRLFLVWIHFLLKIINCHRILFNLQSLVFKNSLIFLKLALIMKFQLFLHHFDALLFFNYRLRQLFNQPLQWFYFVRLLNIITIDLNLSMFFLFFFNKNLKYAAIDVKISAWSLNHIIDISQSRKAIKFILLINLSFTFE